MQKTEITYKQVERPIQKVVMYGRMTASEANTDAPFYRDATLRLGSFTCGITGDHLIMSLEQAHEIQRLCVDGKRLKITLEVID